MRIRRGSYIICLFYLLFLNAIHLKSQTPTLAWAKSFTATGAWGVTQTGGYTADAAGNSYITGFFKGTVDFNPGPVIDTSNCVSNWLYLVKLDPSGNFLWKKNFGISNTQAQRPHSLTTDPFGNIIIVGEFKGTGDFDPGPGIFTLSSLSPFGWETWSFILKFDNNGNFLWGGQYKTSYLNNVKTDATGNIYVAGGFIDSLDVDFGPGKYIVKGDPVNINGCVMKYNPSGNIIWGKPIVVTADIEITELNISSSGNIYGAGAMGGIVDFDPGPGTYTLSAPGPKADGFVFKLRPSGNLAWAKSFTDINEARCLGNSIGSLENVSVCGYFENSIDLDPGPGTSIHTVSSSGLSYFVARLDSSGNYIWGKSSGGSGQAFPRAICTLPNDHVYFSGLFGGSFDFDPGPNTYLITNFGSGDVFLCGLDNNGNFKFAQQFGGTYIEPDNVRMQTNNNSTFISGSYTGNGDYDPSPAISMLYSGVLGQGNGQDDFVIRLNNPPLNTMNYDTPRVLKVFPNPSNGFFQIELANLENQTINLKVYSVDGRLLSQTEARPLNRTITLNLEHLSDGIYYLRGSAENTGTFETPVIINKK